MVITVLAFSKARDVFGFEAKSLEFSSGMKPTVQSVLDQLQPNWKTALPHLRVASGPNFVALSTELHGGESIALIPPVSGG